jgi:hypothetical protein
MGKGISYNSYAYTITLNYHSALKIYATYYPTGTV